MKKLFSALVMLTAFSICAFANDGKDDTEDHFDAQYVITDCGTVHKIPADATEEEACDYQEQYTEEDCH